MALVYRGVDLLTGETVAIKILHPYLRKNTKILERFKREVAVIAMLCHPNIITFYEYHEDEEYFLYVMEYLETFTLEDVLKHRGAIPLEAALKVLHQLCMALSYAHRRNVIHRDVKPSNLFVTHDRGIILSDFGLAKTLAATPITSVGSQMMGTPFYMSPEQVLGEETDWRTDIYQVGILAYQMLVGELPFKDQSHFKTIMMRTEQDLRAPPEEVPSQLARIIERCGKRDKRKRYQSMDEILEALELAEASLVPDRLPDNDALATSLYPFD